MLLLTKRALPTVMVLSVQSESSMFGFRCILVATTEVTSSPPQNAELGDSWQRSADGMSMIFVPSNTFLMGSGDGGLG